MRNLLYHGTPSIQYIESSGKLECNSYPEYSFKVDSGTVLSLTRCKRFAEYYSKTERDEPMQSAIIVIDKDILRQTHKITLGRSTIFDDSEYRINRVECEEFVMKPILLNHPCVVEIIRRN